MSTTAPSSLTPSYRPSGRALFWICALPIAWLLGRIALNDLGEDPEKTVSEFLGLWSVRFLLLTLAVSPLAALTRNSWLTKHRRMLGLYAFFYSALHLLAYLVDFRFVWDEILVDIFDERDPITVGILGFLFMVPLTLTSNNRAIRKMGARAWKRLHWLTFPAAVMGVYHSYLMVRYIKDAFPLEAYVYAVILTCLICYRLFSQMPHWRNISKEDAKSHTLYGFGGWLLVLYGYAALRLLMNLNNIFGNPAGMIGMYGDGQYQIMQFAMAIQMLCLMVFLVLAPTKHPITPTATITALCIGAGALFLSMMTLENFPANRFGAVTIHHGLTALLYALYLTKSRRANVTYAHRIDPASQKGM